jgi:hypothetical protein
LVATPINFTLCLHSLTTIAQFWKKDEKADDGQATVVPEEWLGADIRQGITSHDVESRRKKFGWNEITTDKENLFIKFLTFFTGPILYGKSLSFLVIVQWLLKVMPCFFSAASSQLAPSGGACSFELPVAKSLAYWALHGTPSREDELMIWQSWNSLSFSPPVSDPGSISVSLSPFFCSTPPLVGTRKSKLPMSSLR